MCNVTSARGLGHTFQDKYNDCPRMLCSLSFSSNLPDWRNIRRVHGHNSQLNQPKFHAPFYVVTWTSPLCVSVWFVRRLIENRWEIQQFNGMKKAKPPRLQQIDSYRVSNLSFVCFSCSCTQNRRLANNKLAYIADRIFYAMRSLDAL